MKKHKVLVAQFEYVNPRTGEPYHVIRDWPYKDQQDAELIVKYYGMKTGSVEAQCRIEEFTDEEIKQATSSITTEEAHQA